MRLSGENAALNPREENWSSSEFLPDKPRQIEKKTVILVFTVPKLDCMPTV